MFNFKLISATLGIFFLSDYAIGQNNGQSHSSLTRNPEQGIILTDTLIERSPNQNKSAQRTALNIQLPYPVLFVHGLNSSSETWSSFKNYLTSTGLSDGGTMNYCLNSDNDLYYSNLTDITDFNSPISAGDLYFINFNVDADGTAYGSSHNTTSQSNLAAIVKQGRAIKSAIAHILQVTNKNKVVIVAHSMGGLATREYLQNPNLWQADNQHHIAKLFTLGTPHGGSNTSGTFLGSLFFPDESSDAVRDLRTTYFYSGDPGVYLFGGIESDDVMNDQLLSTFYNVDVNCNGQIYDNITGLNQKTISTNLDFTCIVGDYWADALGGDLIVSTTSAQIKNYYPLSSETFTTNTMHTGLPALNMENILGMDEPDVMNLSYGISTNTLYRGNCTNQAFDAPFIEDKDYFSFNVPAPGLVSVYINNMPAGAYTVQLENTNQTLFQQSITNVTYTTASYSLQPGTYYVLIQTLPSDNSWQQGYDFSINYTPSIVTKISEYANINTDVSLYPNPVKDALHLDVMNDQMTPMQISIMSSLGSIIETREYTHKSIAETFDVSSLPADMYVVMIKTADKVIYKKFIKID